MRSLILTETPAERSAWHAQTRLDVNDLADRHEHCRDMHMHMARGYRGDLDRLQIEDPDEYAQWDRDATIGEHVTLARWHNRVSWLIRWHDRTRPRQLGMFGEIS